VKAYKVLDVVAREGKTARGSKCRLSPWATMSPWVSFAGRDFCGAWSGDKEKALAGSITRSMHRPRFRGGEIKDGLHRLHSKPRGIRAGPIRKW